MDDLSQLSHIGNRYLADSLKIYFGSTENNVIITQCVCVCVISETNSLTPLLVCQLLTNEQSSKYPSNTSSS